MVDWNKYEKRYGKLQFGEDNDEAPQPKKKKKNFWLDQISTLTGTVGGIGGGLLGAAAGGVGAVPGAIGGGAAGSGLGEAIENLITGDRTLDNVGKEAVLGGVFAGGPLKIAGAGARAVAGAGAKSAAKTAATVAGREVAERGVAQTTKAATRGFTERNSQKLLGNALGLKTGAKVGGETLTPQKARALQKFITREAGVPRTASADIAAERLVNFQKLTGQNIDDIIKTADRTLSPQEVSGLTTRLTSKMGGIVGVDPASPNVARLLQQAQEPKTVSELVKFRRGLDDAINYSRSAASPDPVLERAAKAIRSEVDGYTSKLIPGLKTANSQYSQATKALDFVLPNAKTPRGLPVPFMQGMRVGGTIGQRGQSAIGNLSGAIPKLGRNTTEGQLGFGANATMQASTPRGLGGVTNRGIGSRMALKGGYQGLTGGGEAQGQPTSLEDALMQQGGMTDNQITNGMVGAGQLPQSQAELYPQSQSPYSRENLLADIQRDPANAQDYIQYFAMIDEVFNPPVEEVKPLTGESQKRALTAESGLRSLDTLDQTATSDPGAFARQALPNPFGITARATGTTDIRAATDNVVDVLARLRSGAAITDSEAARFSRLLPQPGDSQESALRKLQNVRAELQSFATNPGGGGSLEDALMQYQGGYR